MNKNKKERGGKMEEMTEQEALYILRNCYVMKTEHTLDEENIKLKQAIKKMLKINKKRNQRNNQLREKCKNLIEEKQELTSIAEESISKQIVELYLKEEQERFDTYKKESKENENLKLGMWKHLGAKNMCEQILGIERNIATLD